MRVGEYIVRVCDSLKQRSRKISTRRDGVLTNLEFLRGDFLLLCRGTREPVGVSPGERDCETQARTRKVNPLQGLSPVRLPDILRRSVLWDVEDIIVVRKGGHIIVTSPISPAVLINRVTTATRILRAVLLRAYVARRKSCTGGRVGSGPRKISWTSLSLAMRLRVG